MDDERTWYEVLGVERSNLYKKLRAFGVTPRGGT